MQSGAQKSFMQTGNAPSEDVKYFHRDLPGRLDFYFDIG